MIRIVSDSSTMYSIAEGKARNIDISPLSVTINDKTYKEIEEIQTEEFINIIHEGYIPLSSQPPLGMVVDIYNKYPNDQIINITMADGLSGTYNTACMAKTMVDNSANITVINSKTLCGPHRYLVNIAVELANLDKPKDEILEIINSLIKTSESFLIPHDFDYLVRGGRLSSVVGKISSVIKLVPVMKVTEDGKRIERFTTKRTFSKAIDKICHSLIANGADSNYNIYISHACNEELANTAKAIIGKSVQGANIEIFKLTPAFTTQGGPECIAVQMIKRFNI